MPKEHSKSKSGMNLPAKITQTKSSIREVGSVTTFTQHFQLSQKVHCVGSTSCGNSGHSDAFQIMTRDKHMNGTTKPPSPGIANTKSSNNNNNNNNNTMKSKWKPMHSGHTPQRNQKHKQTAVQHYAKSNGNTGP